jgi:cellulose 1,4-beta-cellobiosidase
VPALSVEPSTSAPFPPQNPFAGATWFVDPHYADKVDTSIALEPDLAEQMEKVKQQPTALWLDRIAAVDNVPSWLEAASEQSGAAGKPAVPVFVVYDLPNRDCAAKSSNGELQVEHAGEERYRTEYVDVIAEHFAAVPDQRIVAVIEPDSLPNLISNMGVEKCVVSQDVYVNSIAYAIAKLSLPNVALYVDAAHAGWLGWEANQRRMGTLVRRVLDLAGGVDRIRGFATNVSNYNALDGDWGKRLESSNPSPNELAYVDMFRQTLADVGIANKGFLVDTSRNGQAEIRSRWGNWCNIRGAGLGERPQIAPRDGVDAYFWIKPPGDSDGTADASAARFDENCASPDATPGAPEAGQWFHPYFVELVKNAEPPL